MTLLEGVHKGIRRTCSEDHVDQMSTCDLWKRGTETVFTLALDGRKSSRLDGEKRGQWKSCGDSAVTSPHLKH